MGNKKQCCMNVASLLAGNSPAGIILCVHTYIAPSDEAFFPRASFGGKLSRCFADEIQVCDHRTSQKDSVFIIYASLMQNLIVTIHHAGFVARTSCDPLFPH
jgi:hypothetical protein